MTHPNESTLRAAYAEFARGNLQGYLDHCTEDIVFHVPGRGKMAGTYTRAQFIEPFISKVINLTNGTFRETVLDAAANDGFGVVFTEHEFEHNGQHFRYRTVHLYKIRDGKLAEFREFPEDLYSFDAAWE